MPTIYVVGDIHGHADNLRKLLSRLGYEQNGGVYRSIGEVMEIVEGMLAE